MASADEVIDTGGGVVYFPASPTDTQITTQNGCLFDGIFDGVIIIGAMRTITKNKQYAVTMQAVSQGTPIAFEGTLNCTITTWGSSTAGALKCNSMETLAHIFLAGINEVASITFTKQ